MPKFTVHPFAEYMPRRSPEQREQLRELLATQEQQVPVVVHGKQLLDGRERNELLTEMGKPVKSVQYEGDTSEAGLLMAVMAFASGRQTQDHQRAMVGAELLPKFEAIIAARKRDVGRAEKNKAIGKVTENSPEPLGETRELVGRLLNVHPRAVSDAAAILRSDPKLAARVKTDPTFNLAKARTALKHHTARRHVEKLRRASGVTLNDCDLRLGDNVEVMAKLPTGRVRTIFADGPYNNGWRYRADPFGDKLTDDEFLDGTLAWMREAARLLADDGSLFVLIDDNYTDHFGVLLRKTGLVRRPTIVLVETFAQYNSAETGLSRNARYLHWYTKTDKPLINTVEGRVASDRQSKYADPRGVAHGRLPGNVWEFTRVTSQAAERCPWLGKPGEAPQLPRSLPERCVLLTSLPGDEVLDPFNGNGITGIAAISNQRRYVGIDRDKKGLDQSRDWIAHEVKRLSPPPPEKEA